MTKKSKAVPATFLAAFAAAILAGCSEGPTQVRRCVDNNGKVLEERHCEDRRYGGAMYGYPRFVYGGVGGNTPGSMARGFTSSPDPNAKVVSQTGRTISRGGLGSSGSARGSGGIG